MLTAALKEAIRGEERDLGIFICGGKGKTSRKTPDEILLWGDRLGLPAPQAEHLVYNSRMTAKVDSSLIQDGFQIYHHSFIFTRGGAWTVVQQGMNQNNQTARRYHWHSASSKDLINEPHSGIMSQLKMPSVLNLTAAKSGKTREVSVDLLSQGWKTLMKDILLLEKYYTPVSQMARLRDINGRQLSLLNLENKEFYSHPVVTEDFAKSKYLQKIFWQLCDGKPENYEKFLATEGVGPKTVRALALVAEMIYGAKPSYEDPARYSFAFGGKDATPYPIDRSTYDNTIRTLRNYLPKAK